MSEEKFVIGRDPGCDFVLADDSVSRRHAQLVARGDEFWLTDYGSANGTSIVRNGRTHQVVGQIQIFPGDQLMIGDMEVPAELLIEEMARKNPPAVGATRRSAPVRESPAPRTQPTPESGAAWVAPAQKGLQMVRTALVVAFGGGLCLGAAVMAGSIDAVVLLRILTLALTMGLTVAGQAMCLKSPTGRAYLYLAMGCNTAFLGIATIMSVLGPNASRGEAELGGLVQTLVLALGYLAFLGFLNRLAGLLERSDLKREVRWLALLGPSCLLFTALASFLEIEVLSLVGGLTCLVVGLWSLIAYSRLLSNLSRAAGGELAPESLPVDAQQRAANRQVGTSRLIRGLVMLVGGAVLTAMGTRIMVGLLAVGVVYTLVGLIQIVTGCKI